MKSARLLLSVLGLAFQLLPASAEQPATVDDFVIVEAALESYMAKDPLGIWVSPTPQFFSSVAELKSAVRHTESSYDDWAAANSVKGLVFKIRWPSAHHGKQFTMHVNCSGPSTGDALDLFQVGRTYRIEVALTNIGRDDFWSCYLGTHWRRIEPPASLMPTNSESGGVAPLICRVESYLSRIPRTHGIDRDPIRYHSPEEIWDPSWDAEAKDVAAGDHALFLECKAILAGLKGVELRILSPPAYAGKCLSLHHSCRVTTNVLAMFPWQEGLEVIAPTNEIGRGDFLLGTHAVTVRRPSGSAKQPSEQSRPTP